MPHFGRRVRGSRKVLTMCVESTGPVFRVSNIAVCCRVQSWMCRAQIGNAFDPNVWLFAAPVPRTNASALSTHRVLVLHISIEIPIAAIFMPQLGEIFVEGDPYGLVHMHVAFTIAASHPRNNASPCLNFQHGLAQEAFTEPID